MRSIVERGNIVAKQVFTMYITKSIRDYDAGKISVNDFNYARSFGGRPAEHVLLATVEQEFDIPEVDTNQIQIDALEETIQLERAQSQSRVNILLDRISKLKAIGHDSSVI